MPELAKWHLVNVSALEQGWGEPKEFSGMCHNSYRIREIFKHNLMFHILFPTFSSAFLMLSRRKLGKNMAQRKSSSIEPYYYWSHQKQLVKAEPKIPEKIFLFRTIAEDIGIGHFFIVLQKDMVTGQPYLWFSQLADMIAYGDTEPSTWDMFHGIFYNFIMLKFYYLV